MNERGGETYPFFKSNHMKKVRFLKDHVNGIKKGQVGDLNTGRADYLVREGIAEYVDGEAKKSVKPKAEKTPCKTC